MKPAILAANIRGVLDHIESNAFGARGDCEEFELEGRMFRILCDVRDIRRMLVDAVADRTDAATPEGRAAS